VNLKLINPLYNIQRIIAKGSIPGQKTATNLVIETALPLAVTQNQAEAMANGYLYLPDTATVKIVAYDLDPLERPNGEIKRRTDAAGIFPDEAAITRPLGALLLEQPDQPAVQRARRMTLETTTAPPGDTTQVSPPVPHARPNRPRRASRRPTPAAPRQDTIGCC
jgi:hypothetical protein